MKIVRYTPTHSEEDINVVLKISKWNISSVIKLFKLKKKKKYFLEIVHIVSLLLQP